MPEPKLYEWSVTIGTACNRRMLNLRRLGREAEDGCDRPDAAVQRSSPTVKGLAKKLDVDESLLNRLAEEVRKDLA